MLFVVVCGWRPHVGAGRVLAADVLEAAALPPLAAVPLPFVNTGVRKHMTVVVTKEEVAADSGWILSFVLGDDTVSCSFCS